jgi:hypothetical protein
MNDSTAITAFRVRSDPWGIRRPSQAFADASTPRTLAAAVDKAGSNQGLGLAEMTMELTASRLLIEAWRHNSARA